MLKEEILDLLKSAITRNSAQEIKNIIGSIRNPSTAIFIINSQDEDDFDPVKYAVKECKAEALIALADIGANINATIKESGNTIIHQLIKRANQKIKTESEKSDKTLAREKVKELCEEEFLAIDKLVAKGAKLDKENKFSKTPAKIAFSQCQREKLEEIANNFKNRSHDSKNDVDSASLSTPLSITVTDASGKASTAFASTAFGMAPIESTIATKISKNPDSFWSQSDSEDKKNEESQPGDPKSATASQVFDLNNQNTK